MFWKERIKTIFKRIITILRSKKAEFLFAPLKKPRKNEDFVNWLDYYMNKRNISKEELTVYTRLNPSTVAKIVKGQNKQPGMEYLIAIILVLKLNKREAKDLVSRVGLAFSPCDGCHQLYLELIEYYNSIDTSKFEKGTYLDKADEFLEENGYKPLPQ